MLHVIVGVLSNSQGDILLARRPEHTYQGGLWEFPGGKSEGGETALQALTRELEEEIGIVVQQARPLICITHAYPEKKIRLDVWYIEQWQGQPWGCEGQVVEWCQLNSLKNKEFPAADVSIITALQLPSLYLITPEPVSLNDKKFFYRLEACLDKNISLVQLRANNLSERDYCYCAEKALTLCDRQGAQLLVNASPDIALSVGTHGVHLNSKRLQAYVERPLEIDLWVAASCHNLADIQQANQLGIDFMVLSPVQPTASHPKATPLGWLNFWQLTEQAHCPVFALGGMKKEDMHSAWAHGAQGIAAIRTLWDH